jgi:hypothetical protein
MKKSLLLLMFSMMALMLNAQRSSSAVKTSVEGGRWEIVQSEITRRDTYKLDKYKGDVYQLVKKSDGKDTWQKLIRIGGSYDKIEENKINFQIFLGGIAAKDQYLINIHTGETWCFYEDSDTGDVFLGYVF